MAEETPADPATQPAATVPGVIEIDIWRQSRRAFPWLQLTRALGMSFGLNKIALAVAGVFLLQLVWAILDNRLLDADNARHSPMLSVGSRWANSASWLPPFAFSGTLERITEPVQVLTTPLFTFVSVNPFDRVGIHAALTGLATIAIWGLFGGAISRLALVQTGWGRGMGPKVALEYAVAHARPLVATPLLPVVVLVLAGLGCAIFGLIFKLRWIGDTLGGLLLIVPIGLGLLMFVLVAGLAAGWPLMVASVAAEGEDELDALSRSFSYLNHRLGRYAFYLFVALLIAIPGSLFVSLIADGTLAMTQWGLALTTPRESLHAVFSPGNPVFRLDAAGAAVPTVPGTSWTWFLPAFWIGFVRLVARAWAYSYFWSSISIIYLLIRKDVDGAEWAQLKPDEIDASNA